MGEITPEVYRYIGLVVFLIIEFVMVFLVIQKVIDLIKRHDSANLEANKLMHEETLRQINKAHNAQMKYIHDALTDFGNTGEPKKPPGVKVNKNLKGEVYNPSQDIDVVGKGDLIDEWE